MQTSLIERTAYAAEHQAKAALRCGRHGDAEGFAIHQNRMYDTLESSKYPYLTAMALVQLVGRGKAMVLKIDRPIINQALKPDAPVIAQHYGPVGEILVS